LINGQAAFRRQRTSIMVNRIDLQAVRFPLPNYLSYRHAQIQTGISYLYIGLRRMGFPADINYICKYFIVENWQI